MYYDAYIWDGVKWWGGARGSAGEKRTQRAGSWSTWSAGCSLVERKHATRAAPPKSAHGGHLSLLLHTSRSYKHAHMYMYS